MVKTIKLDGRNNYLFDPESDEIISKYSSDLKEKYPHFKLRLSLPDQSILTVDGDNITEEYGGDIIIQYNNDKFIIDDGYQPILLNKKLVALNQTRKEKGEFCFKYTKNLDKYTSLYVYATRDTEEPRDSDSIHKVETLLEWMIEDLKEYDETIHTLKIDNAHPIDVKED